ncbi:MAG: protein of unknown function transrane, partial [Verrucomicrobiales bacterium]|nr:protein of unknown function transrane [Verrucomicrobiales bacterium]
LWPAAGAAGAGSAGIPARVVPWAGLGCALMAGLGQGFGTTLSGWANRIATANHVEIHGISQAFQRSIAGMLTAVGVYWIWRTWFRGAEARTEDHAPGAGPKSVPAGAKKSAAPVRKHAKFWLVGAAMFGPVAGVSCYQWARLHLPSAVVVAIAATSTLWVIPLAKWIDRDHPSLRQVLGTVLAVGGIAVLCLVGR